MKQNVGLIHLKNLWSKKSCNEKRGKTTSHLRILTPLKGSKKSFRHKKEFRKMHTRSKSDETNQKILVLGISCFFFLCRQPLTKVFFNFLNSKVNICN